MIFEFVKGLRAFVCVFKMQKDETGSIYEKKYCEAALLRQCCLRIYKS